MRLMDIIIDTSAIIGVIVDVPERERIIELTFALTPKNIAASPLDVQTIIAQISTKEIVDCIREGRDR